MYENKGVCGDKSRLLACLLKELGFGCVLFVYNSENHEAVGIKCPKQYAYWGEYAFVETTEPTIITYWQDTYYGGIRLSPIPDEVVYVYDGIAFNSISEEYNDAQTWHRLISMKTLDQNQYNMYLSLVKKYGLKIGQP